MKIPGKRCSGGKENMAECCEFRAFNPGEVEVYKVGRITLKKGKLKGLGQKNVIQRVTRPRSKTS
jgi:hypothetical protein